MVETAVPPDFQRHFCLQVTCVMLDYWPVGCEWGGQSCQITQDVMPVVALLLYQNHCTKCSHLMEVNSQHSKVL
jgi:hypothetical protein